MTKENEGSLAIFREELAHARHLDWIVVAVFTLIAVFTGMALVFHEITKAPGMGNNVLLPFWAIALAAAGTHSLVTNTADYWTSWVVATRALQAAGLVGEGAGRGTFPESLVAYPPQSAVQVVRRLVQGSRGAFLALYLMLGWASSYAFLHHYLGVLASVAVSAIVPVFFCIGSVIVTSGHLRHVFAALVREGELASSTQEELAERHCSVADTLQFLDPPRTKEALSHYQVALSLDPANVRARDGVQRLTRLRQLGA